MLRTEIWWEKIFQLIKAGVVDAGGGGGGGGVLECGIYGCFAFCL